MGASNLPVAVAIPPQTQSDQRLADAFTGRWIELYFWGLVFPFRQVNDRLRTTCSDVSVGHLTRSLQLVYRSMRQLVV